MATSTLVELRGALSQRTGDHHVFTASAQGSGNKDSWKCASLRRLPGGIEDGGLENWYIYATGSGDNAQESSPIKIYIANPDTDSEATVQVPHTSRVESGDTFELHRIDPVLKHNAINLAFGELASHVYLPIRDESLIVDNRLSNPSFENFTSGAPDNWTASGTGTGTEENTIYYHGTSSLKLIETSTAAVLRYYQDVDLSSISGIAGASINFRCGVYATAASTARIIIDFGSEESASDYHGGSSEWETLTIATSVPSDATRVRIVLEVAASGTGYFDLARSSVGPLYKYTLPTTMIEGPYRVLQQYNEALPEGPYYPIPAGASPTEGRILRLEGKGVLSRPSSESGTAEIGEPHLTLFSAMAALQLVKILGEQSASEQIDALDRRREGWERDVSRLSASPLLRSEPMPVQSLKNVWRRGADSNGKYIESIISRGGVGFDSN